MGDSDSEDDSNSWINWFCGLKGNEFLCEVDSSFIDDVFNLYGIRSVIEDFRDVQDLILGDPPDGDGTKHELFEEAKNFYGLVHARFIVTMRGISLMLEKYENKDFGVCPRYFCKGCALITLSFLRRIIIRTLIPLTHSMKPDSILRRPCFITSTTS
jgi:casein kinase II subunit beta